MTYAWTVKVRRSAPPHYATKKAIRQAKTQSGFKRVWRCVGA